MVGTLKLKALIPFFLLLILCLLDYLLMATDTTVTLNELKILPGFLCEATEDALQLKKRKKEKDNSKYRY